MTLNDREEQLKALLELRALSYNGYSRLTVFPDGEALYKQEGPPIWETGFTTIKLQSFPTSSLKQILKDNAPDYSNDDLLALYTFTDGIPKYVKLFMER